MIRALFFVAGLLVAAQPGAAASLVAGKALYAVCAGCHGFRAEGNRLVDAPKLTALESWYMARQLRYFARGIRGTDEADIHGRQMAPFALALPDERAIEDVVSYIESLPHAPPEPTVSGDTERGRQVYAVCAACHGQTGQGVEQLSSPQLAGLDDWYIVGQLESFRAGLRGAHTEDSYGQQMRPIVGVLQNDQQLADVAAYIGSLSP